MPSQQSFEDSATRSDNKRSARLPEETSVWLEKLLAWVDRCGPPRLSYVGRAGGGFHNPPAPQIEIAYIQKGAYEDLRIGEREVDFPENHVSVHSVHFGNYSKKPQPNAGWCLFIDVSGDPEFRCLEEAPLFTLMPVLDPRQLGEGFERLVTRARRYDWSPASYLNPGNFWLSRRAPNMTASVFIKTALLDLLAVLLENAHAVSGAGSLPRPAAVREVAEFIALHYHQPELALGDIAAAAHLSVDHLGRLFKRHVNETPMDHLKRTRIGKSRFLLERTDLLVEEVAREVGFRDQFHFSRVFRKLMGVSPKNYRKRDRAREAAGNGKA